MLNQIIAWAVRQRLLLLLALLAACIGATLVIPRLNLDAFPDVTNVQVSINTEAPGLAAEEVEQLISYPIEAVMYALPDVEEVRSVSKTGLSGVTVVFKEGTDIYFARQLVFERLQAARELIPAGVGTPQMGPNTSGLGQIFQYLLIAEADSGYDVMALRSLNDWLVKLLLMPAEGVTEVLSFGGEVRQYQVNLLPERLLAYRLTQQQVMAAINANNLNVGGWYMPRGQEQLVIRGMGWLDGGEQGLSQLKALAVKTVDGTTIRLSDIAQVKLGGEIRQGAVTMSQRRSDGSVQPMGEVVSGIVLKRMGANTKATIDAIKERLPRIQQALPEGVTLMPYYDQSSLIDQAVMTVVDALLIAFALIVVVLVFFLLNLRATVLVLLSIPVSIGLALMVMSLLGLSANLMSLGGLAVAIGMLVDGAVVMTEHLTHQLQQGAGDQKTSTPEPSNPHQRIRQACQQVARPVFFASSIILVVFLPLFAFEGVEAKLFQPMAISIMLALLAALLTALLLIPALAAYLFKTPPRLRRNVWIDAWQRHYRQLLQRLIQQPRMVLAVLLALLVATAALLPRLGTEFVPELEEGTINLRVTLAPSASLDTALAVAPKLEAILMTFPEVTYAMSRIGRAEVGGDPEPVSNIEIYIGLKPVAQWQSASNRLQLQQQMQAKLEQHPGLLFNFSQPIATRVDELLSGVKAQLAIKLFGPDLAQLEQTGAAIAEQVKQVDGTRDVALEPIAGEQQLVVRPNREALSRYGLAVADVLALVRDGLGGASAGQIIQGNERYDIYVRLADEARNQIDAIAQLPLVSPSGAWLRLQDVADVNIEAGPPQIRRDDVQRRVVIQANVVGRDMGNVVADIRQRIADEVALPAGYSVDIGGQFKSQQRAQQRLLVVVPLALALIALLLYLAFGHLGQTLLILANVPMAAIGGIWALWLSGQYVSVPSSVGFITLFGVAVLNGVVLVSQINQQRHRQPLTEAILDGATSRLRPVLMTAITSALGLIPMLLSQGVGAEIQRPLATVIVGGLITSTLLTLIVLPVFYRRFSRSQKNV
ncbi:CusA/CzcA family heavy metal efflux RND transporter [Bacterioplanes sanyensis]|uniref:CusA/CzcA family heavy metal efflux RND transporter n=1 Tax=Bacterioplanes sanyensis TaxID=1249553 RepID=A0A222FM10_9GAMM|nr:CusA/CzcA family heavy metal efflux RND transporter [Bacterioplanes sanyensis]ASP39554.1 CusA/CzcA family heavy metal efflux RND transporter [Bacterioplanes sanyensis]